jgi:hypothetical protein
MSRDARLSLLLREMGTGKAGRPVGRVDDTTRSVVRETRPIVFS